MAVEATGCPQSLLKIRPSRDAEGVDMLAQDGDQFGRDGHSPCLARRTVLESALIVG